MINEFTNSTVAALATNGARSKWASDASSQFQLLIKSRRCKVFMVLHCFGCCYFVLKIWCWANLCISRCLRGQPAAAVAALAKLIMPLMVSQSRSLARGHPGIFFVVASCHPWLKRKVRMLYFGFKYIPHLKKFLFDKNILLKIFCCLFLLLIPWPFVCVGCCAVVEGVAGAYNFMLSYPSHPFFIVLTTSAWRAYKICLSVKLFCCFASGRFNNSSKMRLSQKDSGRWYQEKTRNQQKQEM